MPDIAAIMREFIQSMAAEDVEKELSYFTEDAVWVDPSGTYKGKESLKSHFSTGARNMKNLKVAETGNGIIAQGDKAFFEFVASGTLQGRKTKSLIISSYEFSGDKIKAVRSVYDRLLVAQQVAPWFARPLVNMIVKQSEKQ